MGAPATQFAGVIEWAVCAAPLPGETESGDQAIVIPTSEGTLVAVVDGLGHGADAAEAARVAISIIEKHAQKFAADPLVALIKQCHESMRYTRGAVMSLGFFNRK